MMDICQLRKIFPAFSVCLVAPWAFGQPPSVELPLPGGEKLRFHAVFLGLPSELTSSKEFYVGDRSENNPTEPLVPVRIGGAFLEKNPAGSQDWCFYLAETEITEGQWHAVMGGSPESGRTLPKTRVSYFEILEFLNRCNLWLYDNAKAEVPANEGSAGFLRLPTETEWEFAARGGTAVPPEVFDLQIPYLGLDELLRREWVFGSDASSLQLKPVGRTTGSNPLGFFDMLGNASELTSSSFSVEPSSGRVGGFVVKGGDVGTSPQEVRSALRTEFTLYTPSGTPNRGDFLGFRPVIGSNIITSTSTKERIADSRSQGESRTNIPSALLGSAMESNAATTAEELQKTRERLATMEGQIQQMNQTSEQLDLTRERLMTAEGRLQQMNQTAEQLEAIQTQLRLTRNSLDNAQLLVETRNREIARKSVRLASRFASQFSMYSEKLAIPLGKLNAEGQKDYQALAPTWRNDVKVSWESLLGELSFLSDIRQAFRTGSHSEDYVKQAFDQLRQELPPQAGFQRAELDVVESLADEFRKGMSPNSESIFRRLLKAGEPFRPK